MSIDPRAIRREGNALSGRYAYPFDDGSEAEMTYFEGAPGVVTIAHTLQGDPRVLVRQKTVRRASGMGGPAVPVTVRARA